MDELRPPFSNNWSLLGYTLFLVAALSLPLWVPSVSPRAAYRHHLSFDFMSSQIFESTKDVDVVFLGSSSIGTGVDPGLLKAELAKQVRDPEVFSLATGFAGGNLYFQILEDLLQRRRVKMVVVSNPLDGTTFQSPHSRTYFTDFRRAFAVHPDRPLPVTLREYGAAAVGGLKTLYLRLTPFRRNDAQASVWSQETFDSLGVLRADWTGGTREDGHPINSSFVAPRFLAEDTIFRGTPHPKFEFKPFTNTGARYYFSRIYEICRDYGAKLVVINLPLLSQEEVQVPVPDVDLIRSGKVALVGIPTKELFAGLDAAGKGQLYMDDRHRNIAGMKVLSEAYMPALLRLYNEQ